MEDSRDSDDSTAHGADSDKMSRVGSIYSSDSDEDISASELSDSINRKRRRQTTPRENLRQQSPLSTASRESDSETSSQNDSALNGHKKKSQPTYYLPPGIPK